MTARVRQLSWVPAHLENLRSDFSVLHRVDELEEMPARRFFAFCYRIPAYAGVMAAVVARQRGQRAGAPAARRELTLAEWAAEHRDQIEAAGERMDEGR